MGFFGGRGYTDFALALASAFIFNAVILPYKLWRIASKNRGSPEGADNAQSWLDWTKGEFETWQSRLKAADATIEILLPVAAVAIGITVFALIHHFDVAGAA